MLHYYNYITLVHIILLDTFKRITKLLFQVGRGMTPQNTTEIAYKSAQTFHFRDKTGVSQKILPDQNYQRSLTMQGKKNSRTISRLLSNRCSL